MKKICLYLIVLLVIIPPIASAETINLSTYYPAPFGAYDRLKLVPKNTADNTDPCDAAHEGLMWYDLDVGKLMVCDGLALGMGAGFGLAGYWDQDEATNSLFPRDFANPALNVGIRTNAPKSPLHIANNLIAGNWDLWSEYQILLYENATALGSYGIGIRGWTLAYNSQRNYDWDIVGITKMRLQHIWPNTSLTINDLGDVNFILDADTDNANESHQPLITLRQDGGIVSGVFGFLNSANHLRIGNIWNNADADIDFMTRGSANSNIRMTIDGNGKVGIGETNPTGKLHVLSSGTIGPPGSAVMTNASVYLTAGGAQALALDPNQIVGTQETALQTVNGAVRIEAQDNLNQLYLDPGGNIGIYETSPTARLHISRDAGFGSQTLGRFENLNIVSNHSLWDRNYSLCTMGNCLGGGSYQGIAMRNNAVVAGSTTVAATHTNPFWAWVSLRVADRNALTAGYDRITTNANMNVGIGGSPPSEKLHVYGNVLAAAYYFISDERMKENIFPINNALSKIKKLNGVSFTFKEDGRKSIGLTAQNVEEVFPNLVHEDKTSGMKSVEYGNLVAPLIEAVKEQQTMIDQQKKMIDEQAREIKKLNERMQKIENDDAS